MGSRSNCSYPRRCAETAVRAVSTDEIAEGLAIVTARRAILDGIEQHIADQLIDREIETAHARALVRRRDFAEIDCACRLAESA